MSDYEMRVAILLVLIVSTLTTAVRAEGANCTPTYLKHTTGGVSFVIDVPDEEIRRSPVWFPAEGEPPLPPWAAAQIVQDWAVREYADQGGIKINVIELRREFCSVDSNRWYYSIQFSIGEIGTRCCPQNRFAIVLLNGGLYPPVKQLPSGKTEPEQ